MRVIDSIKEMQDVVTELRLKGKRISLVPTMGYLHTGHLSLMRNAREKSDILVVSIFVNPIQFGPTEDYDHYPRDIEKDEQLCKQENVDILFYPHKNQMYPAEFRTYVTTDDFANRLCGLTRPDHFRGVTTIVAKLFNIVKPDIAVFGQKDAQQAMILKRMVTDLNFDIEIVIAPIIREPDGLAMSSRNKYLKDYERREALVLNQALKFAEESIASGEKDSGVIKSEMMKIISRAPSVELEYLEIVDYDSLESIELVKNNTLIALAAIVGNTRLIDNIIVGK